MFSRPTDGRLELHWYTSTAVTSCSLHCGGCKQLFYPVILFIVQAGTCVGMLHLIDFTVETRRTRHSLEVMRLLQTVVAC